MLEIMSTKDWSVARVRELWSLYWTRGTAGRQTPAELVSIMYGWWFVALVLKLLGGSWDISWHFWTIRDNLAPQQNMVGIGVDPIRFEDRGRSRCQLEDTANDGLVCTMTHDIRRRLAAEQKGKRINQYGLARTCLARQQVEAKPEGRDRTVDHSIVFRAQFQQHRSLSQRCIARIANLAPTHHLRLSWAPQQMPPQIFHAIRFTLITGEQ